VIAFRVRQHLPEYALAFLEECSGWRIEKNTLSLLKEENGN